MNKKTLAAFVKRCARLPVVKQASHGLSEGKSLSVKTLYGSLKTVFIASLWALEPRNIVIITAGNEEADEIYYDLEKLLEGQHIFQIANAQSGNNKILHDEHLHHLRHLSTLSSFVHQQHSILIITPDIFRSIFPSPDSVLQHQTELSCGKAIERDKFVKTLLLQGFRSVDFVNNVGDVAVRGGLVDIFPLGWSNPLRIEFWGDEVDSLREFDVLSQRSIHEYASVNFINRIFLPEDGLHSRFYDYLSPETLIVRDSPEVLDSAIHFAGISHPPELQQYQTLELNGLGKSDISIKSDAQPEVHGSIQKLYEQIRRYTGGQTTVWLASDGIQHTKRLYELLLNIIEHDESDYAHTETILNSTTFLDASLSRGFILPEEGLIFYNEHEIFDRKHTQSYNGKNTGSGFTLRELQQLQKGDFVVHTDKGIGKYDGLQTIQITGSGSQDCARILYEGGDVLYVHLNTLHKLQKYSSSAAIPPKLSKLGSSDWERKKDRVKRKLKDIARDLITLYAERKRHAGFSFAADTLWQREFEAAFIYDDTPDQQKATSDVKRDMEQPVPMDRLICGDVGFGKTEVAIRAAFKAVQNGKQVAVLVPTTILAQQHFHTFKDRLTRYPVNVDVLSRFRSKTEQDSLVTNLKTGKVDILIGTHRILSKDVIFNDLGLVVIDEEQRFGVGAKEQLRQLRSTVDTLTLTATPIPRTLNFSLMGARDLSIIETPPKNRLPIETEICEWDEGKILETVAREIHRGGQIFVVNDTIQYLTRLHEKLLDIYPKLRCGIAHGQMDSTSLENVMEKFLERKFDALLTTKIVESGLDIPNANTIIINNAQNFGLAELYQLRGRVGRSNIQAYCMMIIPPVRTLSRASILRLQALEECTDLGSGFQLALRDMEIRGAGNLLGAEQSGFIIDMGYELYQKILDEAVAELREQEFSDVFELPIKQEDYQNEDVIIDVGEDALLPTSYVPLDTERFELYKKLFNVRTEVDAQEILADINDRFGAPPPQAENLLYGVRLRVASMKLGFSKVSVKQNMATIELPSHQDAYFYSHIFPVLLKFTSTLQGVEFSSGKLSSSVRIPVISRQQALDYLYELHREANPE